MQITKNLEKLLIEVSHLFKEQELEFCIAGGWAVSIWSTPRATEDVDFLIAINKGEENQIVCNLAHSLKIVQSHNDRMEFNGISIWRHVVSLKDSEDIFVLDLIIADSPFLKQAVNRRIWIEFKGKKLPLISIEDLILLKKMSNRKQDQVDVENLIEFGKEIDWGYIKKNSGGLGLNFDEEIDKRK